MRKGNTLVSFIGKGQYEESEKGKYKRTIYVFEDGREYNYFLFSEALIEHYKDNLKKIIMIGTSTSSWDALVQNLEKQENEDLWVRIRTDIESTGITADSIMLLEAHLHHSFSGLIEFKLLVHSKELTEENLLNTLSVYSEIYPNIAPNTKLILDITHGFRYMPMLMYQTLQYHGGEFGINDVKILYGELGVDKKSFVRDISNIWKMAEIEKQIYAFKKTFDGIPLGNTLKLYNEAELGNWIINFSDMVQKNYVMQIRIAVRQLMNILKNVELEPKLKWVRHVIDFLKMFCAKFDGYNNDISQYLLVFSYILHEMGLTTQAIIALREALYAKLFERYDKEQIRKYISTSDLQKKDYYQGFKNDCITKGIWKDAIEPLNRERNNIAHAALEIKDGNFGHSDIDFDKYYNAVKMVFEDILK